MPTPFANSELWQHGTFTFVVASSISTVDSRGNKTGTGEAIALTFKLKPSGGSVQQLEESDKAVEPYEAKLVAVNGDYEKFALPLGIKQGDVGDGVFQGRKCKVIVKAIAQSSLSPLLVGILGSSVRLELDYRIQRGSVA
ncbi:hypothetical protein [Chroococcidiopsis sp.]|uniref:hypothetical protein n=1 Tax=Chroococcidiopsis sp. TaxID=3088168 RepID=UPI003F3DE07C